jgi:hypothetical protein
MIAFTCEHCGNEVEAAEAAAGGLRHCHVCGQANRVPGGPPLMEGRLPPAPPTQKSARGADDEAARRRAQLFPPLGPSWVEIVLALLGASLVLAGALLPLEYVPVVIQGWQPDFEAPNSFQTDNIGPVLLALAATALAAALSGRGPALVQGFGWGIAVLILVYLVRTVHFVQQFNLTPPRFDHNWKGGRANQGPGFEFAYARVEWWSWLALLIGAASFVVAGVLGQRRIDAAAHAHREITFRLTEETRR